MVYLLTACNNPSNPAKGQQPERYGFTKVNGYVRYVALQRELQADLTFRTDSTKAIDGLVVLNDELMNFKKRPKVGLQYILNKKVMKFDRSQTFAYVEKDGSQQELSITLPEFDSLKILSGSISQEKGGLLGWEGPTFDDKDGLVLILTDANGQTFSINHIGSSKGNTYQIPSSYAKKMALGPAKMEATRKRTSIQQKEGNTQLLTIEHYLLPISFEVTK